ncbi:hypothetical protein ACFSGI_19520 [Paenibacillus nicotianae]|uniref:Apea-like HEPN domain-containing protein n=1 Tax=Paenibacillus nicotianae TaxID=1526551 RepID=A0ABW4UY37_9BACL
MYNDNQTQRTKYFIERFLQMLKSNGEIEFNSFPICGLLELSRQFVSMPTGIRELSAEYIKNSITQIIDSSILYKTKAEIPIKEVKSLFISMTLIKELKNTTYIPQLYNNLSDQNCYLGFIRTLQHVLKRNTSVKQEEYSLIDELISLIIEYLEQQGNTISELYAICNNWFRQDFLSCEIVSTKIFSHLKGLVRPHLHKHNSTKCSIMVETDISTESNIHSFIEKIITQYELENKIKSRKNRKAASKKWFYFELIKLDGLYVDRVLNDLSDKIVMYKEISKTQFNFLIKKENKLYQTNSKRANTTVKIKHFENLWKNTNFTNVNDYIYSEMLRLNEWMQILNQSTDKRTAFMTLWSIMEFMMVHSVNDNKLDSVVKNFIPYMGLFYFRKISKTFFRRLVALHSEDSQYSSLFLIEHIDNNLISNGINEENLTIADKFCIFIFYKKFKNTWWNTINFKFATNEFINQQTLQNFNSVSDSQKSLAQLEVVLNNDIKQMYRLRNMLTHSGINDSKILDNTYVRLKYYVETIINAISYSWIHDIGKQKTLTEINDYKRVDYNSYKNSLKFIISNTNNNGSHLELLKLMNFKGTTTMPPNRFSFLGEIEKMFD